ncbi:alpha/beta fold hydrolase [Aquihabitans daechungensis]|uniref:alpha/beta fold hydrolase n=1 Tax=Aquihabitans daechungensis TaxID=1052257 RepID=UPI003BA2DA7F
MLAPPAVPPAPTRAEAVDLAAYAGARRPDRRRSVDSGGIELCVWEWGAADAPAILFAHGGFDFAGTYDTLAPLVADRGWRVVSWDQRGHGDSQHAHLYSWDADLRDAAAVLDSVTDGAVPVLGHSKGGALMLQLADALPHRVSHVINLDGSRRPVRGRTSPTTTGPGSSTANWPAGSTTAARPPTRSADRGPSRSWPSAEAG